MTECKEITSRESMAPKVKSFIILLNIKKKNIFAIEFFNALNIPPIIYKNYTYLEVLAFCLRISLKANLSKFHEFCSTVATRF